MTPLLVATSGFIPCGDPLKIATSGFIGTCGGVAVPPIDPQNRPYPGLHGDFVLQAQREDEELLLMFRAFIEMIR